MSDPASIALAVLLSYRLYERRPRGNLTPGLLEVRPSLLSGAGRGCFAAIDIPDNTVLGTYAGRLRPAHEYAAKLREVGPHVAEYCWKIGEVAVLDPTDVDGVLLEEPGVPLLEAAPQGDYPSLREHSPFFTETHPLLPTSTVTRTHHSFFT